MKKRVLFLTAAVITSGGALAIGPGAPWLVDHLADGQRVWRLGRIVVDGVSGTWLGDLRARHLVIADDGGAWLEADAVALGWRPFDLFNGVVTIDRGRAREITILRRPALSESRPARGSFDVQLRGVEVEALSLAETVAGAAGQFAVDLALDVRSKTVTFLDFDLRRTDATLDHAAVFYRGGDAFALQADISGEPGGVFAHALGLPTQHVRAVANGEGGAESGAATYSAHVGAAALAEGEHNWDAESWRAHGHAQLHALPPLRTLARRIGANVGYAASGAPGGAFTAQAQTPLLSLTLNGEQQGGAFPSRARFEARAARLSSIARESPVELGAATLSGEVRQARGTLAVQANLDAEHVAVLGQTAHFSGPLRAALTAETFTLEADLEAAEDTPPLFVNATLSTQLSYDRARRRFSLDAARLAGDSIDINAQGWTAQGDGEYAGDWRVRRLGALQTPFTGAAAGRWRAFDQQMPDHRRWVIAVEGAGDGVSATQDTIAQLLGATPRLDARLHIENGGVTVSHARLDSAKLRAGATGRIVRGEANLALEASARGPLSLGGAEVSGAADATGSLTGRLARPALTLSTTLSSLNAGGVIVERPVVGITLSPNGGGYAGRATIDGAANGQPLTASGNVGIERDSITLSALDGQWGALQAQGSARFAAAGASADLDINGALEGVVPGASGRVVARAILSPETLDLNATLADARFGDLRVRNATIEANGPLRSIDATFSLRGRLRNAPLTFAGAASIERESQTTTARIRGSGQLAQTPIETRAPMIVRLERASANADLDFRIADGAITGAWRDGARTLAGEAHIENAPLAPLAAIWGERAVGRISGSASLANAGRGLRGAANLELTGARFAGRQRGTLDMHVVGELEPSRLTATVDASSTDGLQARFEADAPVATSAAPIRIALAPGRRGQARWSVQGPAESLWTAARLPDQALSGQLDGQGELSFGAGSLSGAGQVELVDGRFEDKLTGVTLTDLDARIALGENGVTIESFTATSPHGGRLIATGGSATPSNGAITVQVSGMRIADRAEARATASGELTLAWEGVHSSLSGALAIAQADLDIAASADAGIPTLDVIEVNRPGEEDEAAPASPRRNGSTALDVRITAPGRVYTRGRGVSAEWALNLRLDGTANKPRLFGDARAVRGTLALSGQPFEVESARIMFNGDPMDAQIDLAAVRDTADLSARIRLTGTARDPEITFSSDPALAEDEILPQILFGRGVADLSPFEAAQLAASLAALSGRASLDLMDAARAAAGLDRFNVRQDEDGGFLVAGGVYLTRDVYVELARTGLGQAQTRVEWTVRPRLVLISSFLGDGDQRVSLRWRRESD